jgi:hypothetical protein
MNSISKLAEVLRKKKDDASVTCREVGNKHAWNTFGRTDEEERQYLTETVESSCRYNTLCEVLTDLNHCAIHNFNDPE